MRYARRVDFKLKTGHEQEFTKLLEKKIVPLLQQQKGFQDEMVLLSGQEVTAISLWDMRKDAEGYEKMIYPQVLDFIKPLAEVTPKFKVCEVPHTTFHATV